MNPKYRNLYFLAATLGVGLLIIGVMKLIGPHGPSTDRSNSGRVAQIAGHQDLEKKIVSMSTQDFSPKLYNNLLIEINAGATQNLFNQAIKDMLIQQLNAKYKEVSTARIQMLLRADPVNQEEIQNLISHQETTFGATAQLNAVKNKFKALNYYTQVLPNKIRAFTDQGFSGFDGNQYQALMNDLERMGNMDADFKKKKSVQTTKSAGISKLRDFYDSYLDWEQNMN